MQASEGCRHLRASGTNPMDSSRLRALRFHLAKQIFKASGAVPREGCVGTLLPWHWLVIGPLSPLPRAGTWGRH